MHTLHLTDEELSILKTITTYATTNDASMFIADDLAISDTHAQEKLEAFQEKMKQIP